MDNFVKTGMTDHFEYDNEYRLPFRQTEYEYDYYKTIFLGVSAFQREILEIFSRSDIYLCDLLCPAICPAKPLGVEGSYKRSRVVEIFFRVR